MHDIKKTIFEKFKITNSNIIFGFWLGRILNKFQRDAASGEGEKQRGIWHR